MGRAAPLDRPDREASPARLPELFERVYGQYAARVYNYCFYHLRDRDRSDDAVSHIFEKVLRNLGRFDPRRGRLAGCLP